jgi:hypothetical protein
MLEYYETNKFVFLRVVTFINKKKEFAFLIDEIFCFFFFPKNYHEQNLTIFLKRKNSRRIFYMDVS